MFVDMVRDGCQLDQEAGKAVFSRKTASLIRLSFQLALVPAKFGLLFNPAMGVG